MQTLPNPSHTSSIYLRYSPPAAFDTTIHRRKTRPVPVGDVTIGGGHPVVVQSMINEDTLDIPGSVAGHSPPARNWL
jgi:(E)-4-hydroxy-3-methylbut-2-enyl-diphosphate synthase